VVQNKKKQIALINDYLISTYLSFTLDRKSLNVQLKLSHKHQAIWARKGM